MLFASVVLSGFAIKASSAESNALWAAEHPNENIKRSLPASERDSLKWTKTGSSLEVFRLQPGAFSAGDYFAYKLINESNAYINPNTGEDIPVPGPLEVGATLFHDLRTRDHRFSSYLLATGHIQTTDKSWAKITSVAYCRLQEYDGRTVRIKPN